MRFLVSVVSCVFAVMASGVLVPVPVLGSTPAPARTKSCPTPTTTSNNNIFGLSTSKRGPIAAQNLAPVLELRGGELFDAETLDEVDGIVLRAAVNDQLVVLDFTATWCGPCRAIAPLFKELSEEMPDVVFVKVDVDENPDTAAKYSVSAMPTFIFIKQGEVIDKLMGANPDRLQALIEEHS